MHVESVRPWCRASVLRETSCLFGLYSIVAMLYHDLPEDHRMGRIEWPGKAGVTFSDALTAVRRWIWSEGVFARLGNGSEIEKLPASLREALYSALASAA